MVNESNAAQLSFSSSQTAQSIHAEMVRHELAGNQNGQVAEINGRKMASAVKGEDFENEPSLAPLEFSPNPPNSLSADEISFPKAGPSDNGFEGHDEGQEDSGTESLGRAIITTHISAQKMRDPDFDESFKQHPGDFFYDVDAEGKVELGGIRVMIEQVVEVEYESDSGP